MQTKCTSYGKRILALVLSLLMLASTLPVTAWAAADAKPEKITLAGSSEALDYEFVDYLEYAWEEIPHYKVTVPAGTKTVQLYGTVYIDSSAGSCYTKKDGLNDWPPPAEYWTADKVGSAAPYTVETRTSGSDMNLSLVKTSSYATTTTAYILEFVEKDDSPAAPAPVLTADLSTAAVTYTCGDTAAALSVQATGSGTLSYQWQVSTTSAADGFEDITDATQSSYTPSTTAPGSFWYRVKVTNTVSGCKPTSITSAAAPVTVSVPAGMRQVKITTSVGYSKALSLTLTGSDGAAVTMTADTSSGYAVYELLLAPGTYTYEARDTVRGGDYRLGAGSITVTDGTGEETFEFYLAYVYASNSSSWTAEDFTTEVRDADGTVVAPGEPHKFASYMAYPYFMAPGAYTYSILPSQAKAAEGFEPVLSVSQTLAAKTSYATWSSRLPQVIATSFTVPKGATVSVAAAPATVYGQRTDLPFTADLSGTDSDVYTFRLTASSKYIYRASGTGLLTDSGAFTASSASSTFDLTETMKGDAKAILRDGQNGAADIRLNGVDNTGSLAMTVGSTQQLRPLRMWQIANDSTATSKTAYALEPDFHYTVVDVEGTGVVTVDDSGLITANSAGTAIVLVTYDAMHVGPCSWSLNKNKTFSAIWPENTGVVVVEVGENAADGPSANMTINSGAKKVAGKNLDAEADVLYYTDDSGCQYTFRPVTGSTVTLLRPTLTETAMTYAGGFSADGVSVSGSEITLTLTEGKNIVRISKDGADTYQVITVKKAGVSISNVTNPGEEILPGDTVSVQLTGVYHPANYMASLYNLYAYISYQTADGSTVKGYSNLYQRYAFDTASGDDCRTIEVKIPVDWDADKAYTLTGGAFNFYGNGKDIGSHRNDLAALNTSVSYIGSGSTFQLGALPDIVIPVTKPATADVTFAVKDDAGADINGCTIQLTNSTGDVITMDTADGATRTLASGTWSYVASKEGYLPAKGTLTVTTGENQTVNVALRLVTAIQVKTLPSKTVYIEGDKLNTAGLVVQAVTRNGAVTLSADQYTLSPTVLDTVGQQVITVTFGALTTTFEVTVREDIVTLETTLEDGITQRNSRMTFDVIAKDGDGKKLPAKEVTVLLNGDPVSVNWDDDTKTSYTLHFTKEGENTVEIKAHKSSLTYTIHYIKAEPGEVVGKAVFVVEALSLGGGYIIEPCYVDIIEGENSAQALARLLADKGFSYSSTGSLESGFYLSHIQGDALADIDTTGDSIPAVLREKLDENGFTVSARSNPESLGEFDYTFGSGWMYCLKNVFPNVGFADSYLSEGDVVRVQFTLAYGSDIGGGYAMGMGGSAGYFDVANKDALIRRVAAINAHLDADPYYLEKNCLSVAYQAAMDVLTELYASQADVDAALANLPDPPVGHKLSAVAEVPAACETAGTKAHWECSVCHMLFSDAEGQDETSLEALTIPALGHKYGEAAWTWTGYDSAVAVFTCANDASHVETVAADVTSEITTPASCESTGVRTYTATVTFQEKTYTDTKTETLAALGHAWGQPVWTWTGYGAAKAAFACARDAGHVKTLDAEITSEVTTQPGCTTEGVRTYTASVTLEGQTYTDTKTESLPSLGHKTELVNAKAATCTEDGYTGDEVCTVCGETVTKGEVIPALGHKTQLVGAKAATCTEDGYTGDEVCTVCGETVTKGEVIPALGHKTQLVNAKEATCTEDGYTGDEVCTVCGETVTKGEVIPATGHKTELVNAKAATCTEDGYTGDEICTVCGETVTKGETIPALGHKTELVNAKAATCTEDGYTGDEVCTVCGETVTKGEAIPALGHKTELVNAKAATCTEDGYTGDEVCTVCGETVTKGEVIPALGHKTELVNAKAATCTEDGYTGDQVCTVCGETVTKGEVIPATGHDYKDGKCVNCGAADPDYKPAEPEQPEKPGVKTGDESHTALWLNVMVLSALCACLVLRRRKAD